MKENKRPKCQTEIIDKTTPSYNTTQDIIFTRKGPPDWDKIKISTYYKKIREMEALLLEPATLFRKREMEALLLESAGLFRKYEESHRSRGPEHLAKAEVNGDIAGRIEALLNSNPNP